MPSFQRSTWFSIILLDCVTCRSSLTNVLGNQAVNSLPLPPQYQLVWKSLHPVFEKRLLEPQVLYSKCIAGRFLDRTIKPLMVRKDSQAKILQIACEGKNERI